MHLLIYAGPAPSRRLVLQYSAQLVQRVATAVTLVTGGGDPNRPLLEEAAAAFDLPAGVALEHAVCPGDAAEAIQSVAHRRAIDLVVLGRLNGLLGRFLPGVPRSSAIVRRVEPSVLRVQKLARPIRRILLVSSGDYHIYHTIHVLAQIARPLKAEVALLHVISQEALVSDDLPRRSISLAQFLAAASPVARTLQEASESLRARGVPTTLKLRAGLIFDEILAELHTGDYGLLVIGNQNQKDALDRILLEDVAGELLSLSPLPVLVAKRS